MAQKKAEDTETATEIKPVVIPDLREGDTHDAVNGTYIVTKAGLPNTCMLSGRKVDGGLWLAQSIDHARSGQGICPSVFFEQVQAATKTADKA